LTLVVIHEYRVGGRTYRSIRLHFGVTIACSLERRAERRLAALTASAAAGVFYDPDDPGRAVAGARLPRRRESWSSSALALALGASQRTVQRALDALAAAGRVQSFGRGRARRWMTPPVPGLTTTLLLPSPLPTG
jgi:hypothetical protein